MNTLLLVAMSRRKKKEKAKQYLPDKSFYWKVATVKPSVVSTEFSLQLTGLYVGKWFPFAGTWGSAPWCVNL